MSPMHRVISTKLNNAIRVANLLPKTGKRLAYLHC